jgi:hypothetical protein
MEFEELPAEPDNNCLVMNLDGRSSRLLPHDWGRRINFGNAALQLARESIIFLTLATSLLWSLEEALNIKFAIVSYKF